VRDQHSADALLGLYIEDRWSEGKVAIKRAHLRPRFGALMPEQFDKIRCAA
jgi:hypothetical protein